MRESQSSQKTYQVDEVCYEPEVIQETPLPWGRIAPVLGLQFAEGLTSEMLYPCVGFMVKDFGLTAPGDDRELGYYSGWIVSSFLFGQFVSSFFWGVVSDRIGRRPVLLFGLLANALCLVLFGFSHTLSWAIFTRLMNGLLNGNMGVIQTYIKEVTDDTNQGRAFGLTGTAWGLSQCLGPVIGGLLPNIADRYPTVFGPSNIFTINPYLLPCVVVAGLALGNFFIGLKTLSESLTPLLVDDDSAFTTEGTPLLVDETTPTIGDNLTFTPEGGRRSRTTSSTSVTSVGLIVGYKYHKACVEEDNDIEEARDTTIEPSVFQVCTSPSVLLISFLMFLFAFAQTSSNELFPIWSLRSLEQSGLGFTKADIAKCSAFMGVVMLIFTSFVFPMWIKKLGVISLLQYGVGLCIIFMGSMPFFHEFRVYLPETLVGDGIFWSSFLVLFFCRAIAMPFCFASLTILIQNSTRHHLGSVNGMFSSITSLSMAIPPVVSGVIFAYTSSHSFPFPFDYHFAFLLCAFCCFICLIMSFFLPQSLLFRLNSN